MRDDNHPFDRLDAKRREQTPQALARLVVVGLFIGLWFVLWLARIPMPVPFLLVLVMEVLFFLVYWRTVFLLPSVRTVELAQYGMLAAEIVFHTTMVYFLGGVSWLGPFAYVFGLIFANTFLDLRRGFLYTSGVSLAFIALIALEATGVVPHYAYLEQGPLSYTDPRLVATTIIAGFGVFFSIYGWVNWVGRLLRQERDAAVRARDDVLQARAELELANIAVRESEEFLAKAQEVAQIGSWDHDMATGRIRCSDQLLRMYGIEPEEFDGSLDTILPAVHPDDRARVVAANAATYEENRAEPIEFRIVAPGGAERVAWAEVELVFDNTGNAVRMVGTVQDITERRRVEQALRDSEDLLKTVVSNVSVVLFALDREGVFTLSEGKGLETLGLRPGGVVGRSVFDVYRNAPPILDNFRRALAGEALVKTVQAGGLTFQTHFTPVWDAAGGLTGVIGVSVDITERKQAEEALREQARRDSLTGVLNHATIVDELRVLLSQNGEGGSHAVALVDVDGLKAV
ncbi:MAG: PAS domain S-box protein, partial [Dehalococcoidia bacterium]